jgi:Precorrin-6B methylase 2
LPSEIKQLMINEATRQYILVHREEDVKRLALSNRDAEVDMQMALQQIAGWQIARKKLPSWAAIDGIVYPPHLNMEQCSSEQTAKYKASLAGIGNSLIDLTGGFGIDFYWMSQKFKRRIYVERNKELCDIAQHNFQVLGLEAEVIHGEAQDVLMNIEHADVIFLDPARRDIHGSRTYGIEDCTPNVVELMPLLQEKAETIILKLSPMLDWRKAVEDLSHVSEVHIVSVDNECKELLLVVKNGQTEAISVVCVNNTQEFRIVPWGGTSSPIGWDKVSHRVGQIVPWGGTNGKLLLFEPNASIMKAGCFKEIEETFGVSQLSANSHLFISDHEIKEFPGRQFVIEAITSMNKQELKTALQGITYANITVRNFPMPVDTLRKKLKIKDGGEVFIFATTLSDKSHKLFICRKIG